MCAELEALNYFQATYSAQLSKSSDFFFQKMAVGVGIAPFWINFVWTELTLTTLNINEEKIVEVLVVVAACCQCERRKKTKITKSKSTQTAQDRSSYRQSKHFICSTHIHFVL